MPKKTKTITNTKTKPILSPLITSEDEKGIVTKLLALETELMTKHSKLKRNWKTLEKFYNGCQWEADKNPLETYIKYNNSGEPIYPYRNNTFIYKNKYTLEVVNKIFPLVETETSILNQLNPRPSITPYIENNETYQEQAYKLNLFLGELFNDKFRIEFSKIIKDAILKGTGVLMIHTKNTDSSEMPFFIKRENVEKIMADNEANIFDDVKFAIRIVTKYYYQLKADYPKLKDTGRNDLDKIDIKEYYVYNEDNGYWDKIVLFENTILKIVANENVKKITSTVNEYNEIEEDNDIIEDEYVNDVSLKCLPIQAIILYPPLSGWQGVSEVENILDCQVRINKFQTWETLNIAYNAEPAVEIDKNLVNSTKEEVKDIIIPGKVFPADYAKTQGAAQVKPIQVQLLNTQTLESAKSSVDNDIREITGISKGMTGNRESGVNSSKMLNTLNESAEQRIKEKEFWIKHGLKSLVKKALVIAKNYLGETNSIKLYDPQKDKTVILTADDFNIEKYNIDIEISNANMFNASDRIDTIIKMKQYAPDMPTGLLIQSINRVMNGLFPEDYIKRLETQNKIDNINTENALKQLTQPPAPQEQPQGQPQEQANPKDIITELINNNPQFGFINDIVNQMSANMPEEQVYNIILQALQNIPKDTPKEQLQAALISMINQQIS